MIPLNQNNFFWPSSNITFLNTIREIYGFLIYGLRVQNSGKRRGFRTLSNFGF